MTKEEFIAKWQDEVSGLVLASFAQAFDSHHKMAEATYAADGKLMLSQLRRVRSMLERMYDSLQKK